MPLSQKEDNAVVWLISQQLGSYAYEKIKSNKEVPVIHCSASDGERWRCREVLPPECVQAFHGGCAGLSKLVFSREIRFVRTKHT